MKGITELSKKDYELIARALSATRQRACANEEIRSYHDMSVDYVAARLADALETTNPLFKRDKFLKACGV